MKLYCPYCGHQHERKVLTLPVDNTQEWEDLEDFEETDGVIKAPNAHIEVGPFNSRNNQWDYDALACVCPACSKSFYVDGTSEDEDGDPEGPSDSEVACPLCDAKYSSDETFSKFTHKGQEVCACLTCKKDLGIA